MAPRLRGEEVEKVPLRHEGDIAAAGRQMAEIGERQFGIAELRGERARFLVRQAQEIRKQPQFVHELERRGMDRVAAEIAQEVRVLLEHDHIDARAREQEAEHHSGGAAADDAAARGQGASGHPDPPQRERSSKRRVPRR